MPRELRERFCCCKRGLRITTITTMLALVVRRHWWRLFGSHAFALAGVEIPLTDITVLAALPHRVVPAGAVLGLRPVVKLQDAMRLLGGLWAFICVARCAAHAPLLPASSIFGQRNRFQTARLHHVSVPDHEAATFHFCPQYGFELLSHSTQLGGSRGFPRPLVSRLLLDGVYVLFG